MQKLDFAGKSLCFFVIGMLDFPGFAIKPA